MSEWKEVLLEDVVSKLGDGLHGTPKYDDNGDYYFINGNNLHQGKILIKENTKRCSREEYEKYKKELDERTILVSINGTLGNIAHYNGEKCFLGKSACYFNVREDVDKSFIRYVVTDITFQDYINICAHGTTIKNVSLKTMREYPFLLPPLPEQRAIASILSSLDDKIDLLHRQNQTLEAMAEALFWQWFVEEKTSIVKLGDIVEIFDSKRIPLSSMQRDKMKDGILYPYYGAAKIMDYINQYIFEGEYLLLGEDGTVQTDEGFPILQLATGKFWVNNHTHVLKAKKPFTNFLLYIIFRSISISHIVTGAVQPKINQGNLKSLELEVVNENRIVEIAESTDMLWQKIKHNKSQIRTLTRLRDTLLPKLMNGKVRIKVEAGI